MTQRASLEPSNSRQCCKLARDTTHRALRERSWHPRCRQHPAPLGKGGKATKCCTSTSATTCASAVNTQAALALSAEAGLSQQQAPPIDAPQSLLFEWWVILSQLLAEKMDPTPSAHMQSSSAAPRQCSSVAHPRRRCSFNRPNGDGIAITIAADHSTSECDPTWRAQSRRSHALRTSGLSSHLDRNLLSWQSRLKTNGSHCVTRGQHCNQSTQPQQRGRCSSEDQVRPVARRLEASNRIGLASRPAAVLIQQCMDMMNFGAKPIEALSAAEAQALAKRVTRLQTAQNEAQKAPRHAARPAAVQAASSVLSPAPQPSQALPPTQSMSVLEPSQLPYRGSRRAEAQGVSEPDRHDSLAASALAAESLGSPNTSSVPTPSMRATSTSHAFPHHGPATDNTFSSGVPLHSVFDGRRRASRRHRHCCHQTRRGRAA